MNKYFKAYIHIFDNELREENSKLKVEKEKIIVKQTLRGYKEIVTGITFNPIEFDSELFSSVSSRYPTYHELLDEYGFIIVMPSVSFMHVVTPDEVEEYLDNNGNSDLNYYARLYNGDDKFQKNYYKQNKRLIKQKIKEHKRGSSE